MIKTGDYLVLYSHCIAIRGLKKSAIYDLQNRIVKLIPNSMYDVIIELRNCSIHIFKKTLTEENKIIFDEYLYWLRDNKLAFFIDGDYSRFSMMPLEYYSPEYLKFCVLEVNLNLIHNYENLLMTLNMMLCKYLELRVLINSTTEFESFRNFLNLFSGTTFKSIQVYIEFTFDFEIGDIYTIYDRNAKINNVFILNVNIENIIIDKSYIESIAFLKNCTLSNLNQFNISDKYVVNREMFLLANNYHPYFYKRAEINFKGELKNSLTHKRSFGNIFKGNCTILIENKEFQKNWFVKMDDIENFKDDPLRYAIICDKEIKEKDGFYRLINT